MKVATAVIIGGSIALVVFFLWIAWVAYLLQKKPKGIKEEPKIKEKAAVKVKGKKAKEKDVKKRVAD